MKINIVLCAFVVVLAAARAQDHEQVPPEPPVTSTPITPPPTSAPTTRTTTTEPPTTPSTTTTTTTISPTTTTTSPTTSTTTSTTTTSPTTSTTTPTSTTSASTTSVAPVTTPAPTPKPVNPDIGTWNVTENNVTCILVKMSLHLNVTYSRTDNSTGHACVHVPADAQANGTCGKEEQKMILMWPATKPQNQVILSFLKNDTKKHFMVNSILASLVVDSELFPNATSNETIDIEHKKMEYTTPLNMSYKCTKNESMNFVNIKNKMNSTVTINHLQLEAFRMGNSKGFSTAEDCEPSETPGIVPIAVGCTLAALIIIVLAAYLIGRRRSQARGYLSM